MRERIRRLWRDTSGQLTLESTLVMPVLMLLMIGLLWTSIAAYEHIETVYSAVHRSEEASDEHAYRELWKASLEEAGVVKFRRGLFQGYAANAVSRLQWKQPVVESARLNAMASAETMTSDPDQWLRTLQLAFDAAASIQERIGSKRQADLRVKQVLGNEQPESFGSHAAAAAYLRDFVGGKQARFATPEGDRVIDALDNQGIAHQAFLTFRESQLAIQLRKDELLLKEGKRVSGIVWHFYRRTGHSGKVGPSETFIRRAKEAGVVIVIHS